MNERSDEERSGGLGEGPGSRGPELQDGESLGGRIVRPSLGFEAPHAGILDADLLTQEKNFLLQAVGLGSPTERSVQALAGPAPGRREGGLGERDDLDHGRSDSTGPAEWKAYRKGWDKMPHALPPGGRESTSAPRPLAAAHSGRAS